MNFTATPAALTRVLATGGARSQLLAHPGVVLGVCCLVALVMACGALRYGGYDTQWLRHTWRRGRLRGHAFVMRREHHVASAQADESSRVAPTTATPAPVAAISEQALRVLASSSPASTAGDQAWQALAEDIPGVGRVEWDSRTVRTFAYQPEVLYRLAFHRWRRQQGKLSEFWPEAVAAREKPMTANGVPQPHTEIATWHRAHNPDDQRTLELGNLTAEEA